ncbi:MAG: patatin-like phospholipase family protein [Acidimicrobiia bacterium]
MPSAEQNDLKAVKRPVQRGARARASSTKQGSRPTTAIVLAGAGARGAYEAGVLSVFVARLVEERDDRIVLVGTSAGAIVHGDPRRVRHRRQCRRRDDRPLGVG